MLEWMRENGLEGLGRFYSTYRGVVIDNEDPEKCQRLLVEVPSITDTNVWAYPKGQQGSLGSGFKMLTPEKQDIVWIEFENGDPNYPVWSYCGWSTDECPKDLDGNRILGFVTPEGNKVIIDDVNKTCKVIIKVDESTFHSIELTPEKVSVSSPKPIEIKADDQITIYATDNLNLKGKEIILNEGDVGTTMTDQLVTKLNTIENDLNTLKSQLAAAAGLAVPQDGGKAAFSSLISYGNTKLTPTQLSDLAHKTVKQ